MKKLKRKAADFIWKLRYGMMDQPAMGTVEVILIILVLIGLVIIFKDRITSLVESIFKKVTSQAGKI